MDNVIARFVKEYKDDFEKCGIKAESFLESLKKSFDFEKVETFADKDSIMSVITNFGRCTSRLSFDSRKRLTRDFYTILIEEGLVPDSALRYVNSITISDYRRSGFIETNYFKDIEEVFLFFDNIEIAYCKTINWSLIRERVIVLLLWYGFNIDEICDICYSDVDENESSIRGVKISNTSMKIIKQIMEISCIMSFPSLKAKNLVGSKKLVRGVRGEMTPDGIRSLLKQLNKYSIKLGKSFRQPNLMRNGMFCYARNKYKDVKDVRKYFSTKLNQREVKETCQVYALWSNRYWRE